MLRGLEPSIQELCIEDRRGLLRACGMDWVRFDVRISANCVLIYYSCELEWSIGKELVYAPGLQYEETERIQEVDIVQESV